ncbi:uncharacterized protein MAM_03452 [Metarhizium album ARSEF 1941]|uniref:F-box domain-containing protein n=1 Tax=Metarhizium album (strain ARSEF 1941) TaxID=1081103 RepID=A0A0B2X1M3_METAS|nr:uncharacterized protein MAM_03452 [Metarhizium album ARSEF 1941]KHN98990.1 hypothetical protein MAM_03452 [Metarhizium album ARSEF 1941]
MVLLDDAPQAVLDCLATHLPLETLCNVRLSCQRLRAGTLSIFGRRYFRKRGVVISIESLRHLYEITHNPRLASSVREVEVSTMRLPNYVDAFTYLRGGKSNFLETICKMQTLAVIDDLCEAFLSQLPNHTTPQHHKRCASQYQLLDTGVVAKYLSKALNGLPNCARIVLTDRAGWGAKELAQQSGTPLMMDFPHGNPVFSLRLWNALLLAVSRNPGVITEVGTSFKYDVPQSVRVEIFTALSERQANLETTTIVSQELGLQLAHITSLRLEGLPCANTWWGGSIVKLVNTFPRLLRCSIDFACFGDHVAVRELSSELFMPHIQVLECSMFAIREQDLYRFLSRHRYTLKEVSLRKMTLKGQGSWYSLLAQLSRDLKGLVLRLDTVRYGTCVVKRRVLNFLGNEPNGTVKRKRGDGKIPTS